MAIRLISYLTLSHCHLTLRRRPVLPRTRHLLTHNFIIFKSKCAFSKRIKMKQALSHDIVTYIINFQFNSIIFQFNVND